MALDGGRGKSLQRRQTIPQTMMTTVADPHRRTCRSAQAEGAAVRSDQEPLLADSR